MRKIIKLVLAGLLSVSTLAVAAESSPEALRIGYQKAVLVWCWQKATSYWKNAIRKQKSPGRVPRWPTDAGGVKRWQYRSRQYRGYSANLCPGCRG